MHVEYILHAAYLDPHKDMCVQMSNVIYLPNMNRRVVRNEGSDLPEILTGSSELCDHSGPMFPHSRNGHSSI